MRYEPNGKKRVPGLSGIATPICGAFANDSACAINASPNRSAVSGME